MVGEQAYQQGGLVRIHKMKQSHHDIWRSRVEFSREVNFLDQVPLHGVQVVDFHHTDGDTVRPSRGHILFLGD